MRLVIQRVQEAWVTVENEDIARIGRGLLVLVGVQRTDTRDDGIYLAEKIVSLRVFNDESGKMNYALKQVDGSVLAVSQFTLLADCRKGNRPSFHEAAPPDLAKVLFDDFCVAIQRQGVPVATGVFGAMMRVGLINDGPVTIVMDSRQRWLPRRGSKTDSRS